MRAGRLVSVILLLQARGRMTAEALAAELEVSVRTVYRDIEALHGAGVPLHGEPGHDGGYRLLPGYRTQLTGLTGDEAAALTLSMLPAAAADLGLGAAAAGAATKLRAALSDDLRARADHVQGRLHIDLPNWYAEQHDQPLLVPVADAVWRQHRLRVVYRRWKEPQEVTRTLDPFGLVLKGGRWYVVARTDGQVRTYKVANLLSAVTTGERFDRPDGFDLAAHWRRYLDDFADRRHTGTATVRLSGEGMRRLPDLCPPAVARAVLATAGPPGADGWVEVAWPIESLTHTHSELLRFGADLEVLAPPELRARVAATAASLAARYGSRIDCGVQNTSSGS
ncbi:YafY family transcriptional regulator [Dactylosporangium sp. NBC_01737]|uniref:helix-turn-helix transcriptional regulator n=1 Tax=Dactylosporangium sp. NBC_01737 TaxID=2975959 RepID=UPI002E0ED08C|nr:YafY family transcriptional regulator [Dactylosporangium sp. NBC_01737]